MIMHTKCVVLAAMLVVSISSAVSQEIQRLDPALDQLVPANAKLEKAAGGFDKWTEGPVWTHQGNLLFAEIPANNIVMWIPAATRDLRRTVAQSRVQTE
jgi:gluconolactonase